MATTIKKKTVATKNTKTATGNIKTEEKFDVVLKTKGAAYLRLIKEVRDINKSTLDEAKSIVDNLPAVIVSGVSKTKAIDVGKVLEDTGSKVAIVASKKAKTSKPTSKASELSVTGNKKIETLCKEFNKKFPCLQLCIFYSYARDQVKKGESITPIDRNKTLASVRRANSGGDISISGNKKIKSLEKEFDTVFGLYCQVCYYTPDGRGVYTSGSSDGMTLSAFNEFCEKRGCPKDKWK